jgi:predicted aspartyl protease
MKKKYFSFTTSYNKEGFYFLITRVKLSKANKIVKNNISGNLYKLNQNNYIEYNALWDTGASRSLIDKKVVRDLDLKSIATTNLKHFSIKKQANIYSVDIIIFNTRGKKEVLIENLKVAEDEYLGADVIIGLDLIVNFFDVAITNTEKIINFSIRCPSIQTIDFEKYSYKETARIKG